MLKKLNIAIKLINQNFIIPISQLPAFSLAEQTYYAVPELQLGKGCV